MLDYFERLCPEESETFEPELPTSDPEVAWAPTPLTIVRASGWLASSWSDKDYEEMASKPSPAPAKYEASRAVEKRENNAYAEGEPHVRVHITQYVDSEYQKGSSKNFEIKADYNRVYNLLVSLKSRFSGKSNHRVRIQLQNKVDGRMQGGRNLSLPGATVPEVYQVVCGLLDEAGLLAPKEGNVRDVGHLGHRSPSAKEIRIEPKVSIREGIEETRRLLEEVKLVLQSKLAAEQMEA